MPVATQGSVKALGPDDLKHVGAQILLSNTYHLMLRPGIEVVESMGGLHNFMGWRGPILTDSGGYQTFSLGRLQRLTEEGMSFRSHIDGSEHFLSPEMCIEYQDRLGVDIAMVLDQCTPYGAQDYQLRQALERTHRWAVRCKEAHRRDGQALFAIVQGGVSAELRWESAGFLIPLDFDGYAVGGLSVGEPKAEMYHTVSLMGDALPQTKPRYLMGVGSPEDLVECAGLGMDLFDCALPTRVARNGGLLTRQGRLNVVDAAFARQESPIDMECDCYTCQSFSAAYLHHLFRAKELLAYRLATIHNLRFVMHLMEAMRTAIREGRFAAFRERFLGEYRVADEEVRRVQKERWLEAQHRGEPQADVT
ncbi:MAG: tRNA guanosine(34) transglycosylase Tgt, partial [Chloroflexi bacterium]|nr:tRNA guanosine(34) transglycosylase Tgt [Chloroflexota bacterium]